MQETEPDTKNGLWLQTNKTYQKVLTDSEVATKGDIVLNKYGSLEKKPTKVFYHNNEVYVFVTNALYKYSVEDNEFTLLKEDIGFSSSYNIACYIKGYVYFLSTTASYKFNMNTYEYETIANLTTANTRFANNDDFIFTFSGWSNTGTVIQKYDIKNNTVTKPISYISSSYLSDGEIVGDILYIFGDNDGDSTLPSTAKRILKYNILTTKYSSSGNTLLTDFSGGRTVKINTDIYLIGGNYTSNSKSFYKYDTTTGNIEDMGILPIEVGESSKVITDNKGQILIFTGKNLIIVQTKTKSYEDKSIVIQVKPLSNIYETSLIKNQNISFCFIDVFYYTIESGANHNIPTYYGDGTKWIKFKN